MEITHKNMFIKALFVITSTVVISVYKQLTVQCSVSNTSHIKLWDILNSSALNIKNKLYLKTTAKLLHL